MSVLLLVLIELSASSLDSADGVLSGIISFHCIISSDYNITTSNTMIFPSTEIKEPTSTEIKEPNLDVMKMKSDKRYYHISV